MAERWQRRFDAQFEVRWQDLTSTQFESVRSDSEKKNQGYSRDHRGDGVQLGMALVVTPDGLPLAYDVRPGNTSDKTTLADRRQRLEAQYGRSRRPWVMDRGIPTEATLAAMRAADPPFSYLVGTPRGRRTRVEKRVLEKPGTAICSTVDVKLLPADDALDVLARRHGRVEQERARRRRRVET